MRRANPFNPEAIRDQHFPLLIGGHYRMRANYRIVRPKGTPSALLLFTFAGEGLLRTTEGKIACRPDTLVLFPPDCAQDYATAPEGGYWDFCWCHFHLPEDWKLLLEWPDPTGQGMPKVLSLLGFPPPLRRRLRATALDIARLAQGCSPDDDALAMNLLENIFLRCRRALPPTRSRDIGFVGILKEYILDNLSRPLSVARLAEICRLSPSLFAHRFVEAFGETPRTYVERCRLEHAKRLLVTGQSDSVKSVAYTVGFRSPYLFSTRFRAVYGFSPSALLNTSDTPKHSPSRVPPSKRRQGSQNKS